ncbi:zinc-dependent metalloprotease [Tomitella biformata]|uniref:zinc-dependent metalloprotease n=1 Tax=Tomitella biformata TaxID=630403 RepID=UPI0004B6D828|nr:zinc-dependent metalloprotease [Tomitella biformata]
MSDTPFGFSSNDPDDPNNPDDKGDKGDKGGSGSDPFGFAAFGQQGGGNFDPSQLGEMLSQFGQMLSGMGGAMAGGGDGKGTVNYELASKTAKSALKNVVPVTAEHTQAVVDAVRLAELWMDENTTMPTGVHVTEAWTPAQWIDATIDSWQRLCDPVANQMATMWTKGLPAEAQQMAGPMMGMITQMSGAAYGQQLGQALGHLSTTVLTSTEIGLPLGRVGTAALLPAAIATFGEGLEQPRSEVLMFLAAREAAHHRLFSHVPWLSSRLFDAVESYARGITMDFSAIEEAARNFDPTSLSDPSALQDLLGQGTFEPKDTPEQKAALERLEVLLALVEGWVSTVVGASLHDRIPGANALGETLRRRRASGGPAEQTFATLVGLELRPRKLREAAALWSRLTTDLGIDKRDEVWAHPDLLPDSGDLDNPAGFIDRLLGGDNSDFDNPIAQLERLEEQERKDRENPASDEAAD